MPGNPAAPTLVSLSLPDAVDVTSGPTVASFSIAGSDAVGIAEAVLVFTQGWQSGGSLQQTLTLVGDGSASSTDLALSDLIDSASAGGDYQLASLQLIDNAGAQTYYSAADLAGLGLPTSFHLTSLVAPDSTPPTLVGLTLPSVVDVSHGSTIAVVSASAADAGAGVDHVEIGFSREWAGVSGDVHEITVANFDPANGDSSSGLAFFGPGTSAGDYDVAYVTVVDKAGNTTTYDPSQLAQMGVAGSFEVQAQTPHPAAHDFNGDGSSDILWRQSGSGMFSTWLVTQEADGYHLAPNATLGTVDPSWRIAGIGDLNGDGSADLVWRNAQSGQFTIWEGQADGFAMNTYIGPAVGTNWTIAGLGDFDGDGKADLLWRDSGSGTFTIWRSTNDGFEPNVYMDASVSSPSWKLAAVADFDGDGKADLLWRNADSGIFTEWRSTGAGFTPNVYLDGSVTPDWALAATGDFDGDGKADLLWRNAQSGLFTVWRSTGTGFTPNVYLDGSVGPDWHVAQVADFNGDGKADILWRHDDGGFTIWASTGTGFQENVVMNFTVGPDWAVQNPTGLV